MAEGPFEETAAGDAVARFHGPATFAMPMRRLLLIILTLLPLGCGRMVQSRLTIDEAYASISRWGSAVAPVHSDAAFPGSLSISVNDMLPYPLSIQNSRRRGDTLAWDVVSDTSGVFWDAGTLTVKKVDGGFLVEAPRDQLYDFVVRRLTEGAPTRAP